MDFLGKVTEITNDGRIIVKCSKPPEIGETVYDAKQNRFGIVRRVFGPVDGPYASVETKLAVTDNIRETDLYTRGGNNNGKNKGRSRRNRSMSGVRKSPPRP